jgi:integrase/recombinase XerD
VFYLSKKDKNMAQAKTLTQAEFDQALRYISTRNFAIRNRTFFLISHWSGMRVGEISSLTIADVVNADGSVKAEIRLTAEQTKGRYPRTVYLPQKLIEEIQYYLRHRCVNSKRESLFYTTNGKPITANSLCQYFFWMYRKAGIAGASSHSGRRNFITSLAAKGISVRVLASLAGHRDISVTQKYIDVNDDMKRAAVELVVASYLKI